MKHKKRKQLQAYVAIWLIASCMMYPVAAGAAGNGMPDNMMLPVGGTFVSGTGTILAGALSDAQKNGVMDVKQNEANVVIRWEDFSIGANAQVNFSRNNGEAFSVLNYVTGGNTSQIYGKMNAAANGSVYLVNPNGVQIGNSAEINVGSLYVSNKKLDDTQLEALGQGDMAAKLSQVAITNAELMSLGYIDAKKVTFDGDRVVIDMDRLNRKTQGNFNLDIRSQNHKNVVLGSSQTGLGGAKLSINESEIQNSDDCIYAWVHDGKELQNISKNPAGRYALRNAIDLTGTTFTSIGTESAAFTGVLDGIGNNIFGLQGSNGLFGVTDGARIGHFNLIAGKAGISIEGTDKVGALIGYAKNTLVEGVTTTLDVKGKTDVGGLVGWAENSTFHNVTNTGTVQGYENVGGLIGQMEGGKLGTGEKAASMEEASRNMGKVEGIDASTTDFSRNIGGLVGTVSGAIIGNENGTDLSNLTHIEGGYNVGGIVGKAVDTKLYHLSNEGNIKAHGYTDGTYTFHTDYTTGGYSSDGIKTVSVRIANAGGIVGTISVFQPDKEGTDAAHQASLIDHVTNSGNIETGKEKAGTSSVDSQYERYMAGHVGGIAGEAKNTNIAFAANEGAYVYGAHNVGGIVGFFGRDDSDSQAISKTSYYRIRQSANEGGDIMATGAVTINGDFSTEITRNDYISGTRGNNEEYVTGNMGGIAGYVSGVHMLISDSGNRGKVHSYVKGLIDDSRDGDRATGELPTIARAANVGGVVGKIDRSALVSVSGSTTLQKKLQSIKDNPYTAGISGGYNLGSVSGYANIGGIAGFSYNGSIASSYNLGNIHSTRVGDGKQEPSNIGGILGDSTEHSAARTILYDVWNEGTIGDPNFTYYGRHIGGIAGRFGGIIEKAYNTGAIYNASNVVGGIVGWWTSGYIKNVFNTGNITVIDNNTSSNDTSKVGGIVGGVDLFAGNHASGQVADMSISYAYNLGTLRSFKPKINTGDGHKNGLGGIVGGVYAYADGKGNNVPDENKFALSNVYTIGNLASFVQKADGTYDFDNNGRWAIIGSWGNNGVDYNRYDVKDNVYAIKMEASQGFGKFEDDNNVRYIDFSDRFQSASYQSKSSSETNRITGDGFTFYSDMKDIKEHPDSWRIDEGTGLPILNAFYTDTDKFKAADGKTLTGLDGVKLTHHGTAYNPYLTIVEVDKTKWNGGNLSLDAGNQLAMRDSLAVYGTGLSLSGFGINITDANRNHLNVYGGYLYSDGELSLSAKNESGIAVSQMSHIYGSSVKMDFHPDSALQIFGEVTATGTEEGSGDISISARSLESYWKLNTAKKGETTYIPGMYKVNSEADYTEADTNNPNIKMKDIGTFYSRTTEAAKGDGNLSIHTTGDVQLLYGHTKKGKTTVYGNMDIVSDSGNVYIDTDLYVGGHIALQGDKDLILDATHVGALDNGDPAADHAYGGAKSMQQFFQAHAKEGKEISFHKTDGSESSQGKIALDMWRGDSDSSQGSYNFKKFDTNEIRLKDSLATYINRGQIYVWVKDEYQLKGIQEAVTAHADEYVLSYNFALKNNIEASALGNAYQSIGSGETAFRGIFDGMNHAIIGLNAKGGIFDKLENAHVSNLSIYASDFSGDVVGALASTATESQISEITGLGNTIIGTKHIGGLVGKLTNVSSLNTISDQSTVIAQADEQTDPEETLTAGGLVGSNEGGFIYNGSTNSAVTIDETTGAYSDKMHIAIGGIAGSNDAQKETFDFGDGDPFVFYLGGEIENTSAHGVTGRPASAKTTSGGITGVNHGYIKTGYNESVIYGNSDVGGIAGRNTYNIENVTNALTIDGRAADGKGQNIGGIVGLQEDNKDDVDRRAYLESGRNTATIHGDSNVGGIVGNNSQNSQMHNLENDFMAEIVGKKNVGGIAGINNGTISADGMELINSGTITGNQYVGGVAGLNTGFIQNISTDIALKSTGTNAQFFGGVTGWNQTGGIIENAKNKSTILAPDADYVGGITGRNSGTLQGMENTSSGIVIGGNHVGGIIGLNESAIKATPKQRYTQTTIMEKVWIIVPDENGDYVWKEVEEERVVETPVVDEVGNPVNQYFNTVIANYGEVIAKKGGAGGIIGSNQADLTQVTLINSGHVHGNDGGTTGDEGTGGIIGTNSGNIRYSSLINDTQGEVTGLSLVGGLIGWNKGTVEGGRLGDKEKLYDFSISDNQSKATDQGFYQNTLYNNGTIRGGTFNVDGFLDDIGQGTTENNRFTAATGKQLGGIIGYNEGTLRGAYNTGSILASESTAVGGIAGYNKGNLDQVFTHGITADATNQKISGSEQVGGIVGYHEGTLTNAYTAGQTEVTGNAMGLIAGQNSGTISYVYGKDNRALIGNGNAATAGYGLFDQAKDYGDFAFGTETTPAVWKIYEGRSNPLLKLFLTTVTVDTTKLGNLTYDGKNHTQVDDLIKNGVLSSRKYYENGIEITHDDFQDYKKNNDLLQSTDTTHAGTYENWLWSGQIGFNKDENAGFNPNILGYDFEVPALQVAKRTLSLSLGDVKRTYGDAAIKDWDKNKTRYWDSGKQYGFDIIDTATGEKITADSTGIFQTIYEDLVSKQGLTQLTQSDAALADGTGNRVTQDAGTYQWRLSGILSNADYAWKNGVNQFTGSSIVEKANLHIVAADAETTVGQQPSYDYKGTSPKDQLVNGDTYDFILGGEADNHLDTPGTYDETIGVKIGENWYYGNPSGTESSLPNFFYNYQWTIEAGTLHVTEPAPKPEPPQPDPPDVPKEPGYVHWDYLFHEYPWDKERNERERKAEIHFVSGGMRY